MKTAIEIRARSQKILSFVNVKREVNVSFHNQSFSRIEVLPGIIESSISDENVYFILSMYDKTINVILFID